MPAGQLTILGFISLVASLLLFSPAVFPTTYVPEVTRSRYAEDWDLWIPRQG
jgi:hypothetical protein